MLEPWAGGPRDSTRVRVTITLFATSLSGLSGRTSASRRPHDSHTYLMVSRLDGAWRWDDASSRKSGRRSARDWSVHEEYGFTDPEALGQRFARNRPTDSTRGLDPRRPASHLCILYPGAKSTRHHHAGSVFAYVLSGSIRSENSATGPVRVYKAGESFLEPPGREHVVSENASASEPASLLAVFVADDGARLTAPGP